jgi:hypothetical protein
VNAVKREGGEREREREREDFRVRASFQLVLRGVLRTFDQICSNPLVPTLFHNEK